MKSLNDITLYELFHPEEGQREFQLRANYISGLYRQFLHGYKPLHTSRISISLVPKHQPPYAFMVGSIATAYQYIDATTYNDSSDSAKLRYLLDCLHEAVDHLCRVFPWDKDVFEQSYQQVQNLLHLELLQTT